MAIVIPELELVKILNNFVKAIKADYDSRANKDESILASIFQGLSYDNGKYDLYTQAVDLFITRSPFEITKHERKLTIRSYYDKEKQTTPTIHIAAPSEEEHENWLGGGFDSGIAHTPVDGAYTSFHQKRVRRYQARHAIIFTSDNWIEVQLMYFLIKSGILSIFDTLILEQFQNPQFAGHELQMSDTAAPEHFYSRSIIITSSHEAGVPNFQSSTAFSDIMFPRSNDESAGNIGDEDLTIYSKEGVIQPQ